MEPHCPGLNTGLLKVNVNNVVLHLFFFTQQYRHHSHMFLCIYLSSSNDCRMFPSVVYHDVCGHFILIWWTYKLSHLYFFTITDNSVANTIGYEAFHKCVLYDRFLIVECSLRVCLLNLIGYLSLNSSPKRCYQSVPQVLPFIFWFCPNQILFVKSFYQLES